MDDERNLVIFGRDLSKIPCLRNTFLFSISSGLGFGLAHFMFTSKVAKSCHVGMITFTVATLGFWVHCRYNYAVDKFTIDQIPKEYFRRD